MQIYVPYPHNKELNTYLKNTRIFINKYGKRFLLEKDDKKVVIEGTKDDHWYELNQTLNRLRETRTYLVDKYKLKTEDSRDPLQLTTHRPGLWLNQTERNTFGGYTGLTGSIDFNTDIE